MGADAGSVDDAESRRALKAVLDAEITACRRCDKMNIKGVTASAPGFGNLHSPVALVGQSLCEKCMESGIPFTGGSGDLIEVGIKAADQVKENLFTTNAVHCHPEGNRKSAEHEIVNCSPFLYRELEIVRPRLAIALGQDAERVLTFLYPRARVALPPFAAPRGRLPKSVPVIFVLKHPSWVQRKHSDELEAEYVENLAAAIRWSFDR